MTGTAPAGAYGRRIALSGLVTMLAWDVGLPLAAYYVARAAGWSAFWSLVAATIVAGLRVVWGVWQHRRVDAFSAFMMTVFALGMVLSAVTGDARWLLVKGCLVTAIAGLIFVASAALRRPLTFTVGKRLAVIYTTSLDVAVAASAAIQIVAYNVMLIVTIRRIKAMRALAASAPVSQHS